MAFVTPSHNVSDNMKYPNTYEALYRYLSPDTPIVYNIIDPTKVLKIGTVVNERRLQNMVVAEMGALKLALRNLNRKTRYRS